MRILKPGLSLSLRLPDGLDEMGKFGISFFQTLILFDRWVGHRLLPKKTVPVYHHAGKSLSLGFYGSDQGKLHFWRTCFVALLGCRVGWPDSCPVVLAAVWTRSHI